MSSKRKSSQISVSFDNHEIDDNDTLEDSENDYEESESELDEKSAEYQQIDAYVNGRMHDVKSMSVNRVSHASINGTGSVHSHHPPPNVTTISPSSSSSNSSSASCLARVDFESPFAGSTADDERYSEFENLSINSLDDLNALVRSESKQNSDSKSASTTNTIVENKKLNTRSNNSKKPRATATISDEFSNVFYTGRLFDTVGQVRDAVEDFEIQRYQKFIRDKSKRDWLKFICRTDECSAYLNVRCQITNVWKVSSVNGHTCLLVLNPPSYPPPATSADVALLLMNKYMMQIRDDVSRKSMIASVETDLKQRVSWSVFDV